MRRSAARRVRRRRGAKFHARGGLLFGLLRLDDGAHAAVARRRRLVLLAVLDGEELRARVVGDVVAAHLVLVAREARALEEFDEVLLAVVLDAQRLAVDPLVD